MPPGNDPKEDFALWRIRYPDGDEEDLEQHEMRAAMTMGLQMTDAAAGRPRPRMPPPVFKKKTAPAPSAPPSPPATEPAVTAEPAEKPEVHMVTNTASPGKLENGSKSDQQASQLANEEAAVEAKVAEEEATKAAKEKAAAKAKAAEEKAVTEAKAGTAVKAAKDKAAAEAKAEAEAKKKAEEEAAAKRKTEEEEEEAKETEDEWKMSGHRWIGQSVPRVIGGETVFGKVTRWMPAGKDPKEDFAMWHIVHSDGDEEDLEEWEMREALAKKASENKISLDKLPAATKPDTPAPSEPPQEATDTSEEAELTEADASVDKEPKLCVGNTHKSVPGKMTHRWTVFVRGEDGKADTDLGIKEVVFHIHQDYTPSSVHVKKAPFEITRDGYGVFEVTIDVTLVDGTVKRDRWGLKFGSPHSYRPLQVAASTSQDKMLPAGFVWLKQCKPEIKPLSMSEIDPCTCDPAKGQRCTDGNCSNRALNCECLSEACPVERAGFVCGNQRFQKGLHAKLEPRKSSNKGHGLFALEDIKKGDFVIEYVGEVISLDECNNRLEAYSDDAPVYMMALTDDKVSFHAIS